MRIAVNKRLALLFTCSMVLTVPLISCGSDGASGTPAPAPTPVPTPAPTPAPNPGVAPTLNRSVLMTGIQSGWDFAFTPDGQTIFFTEICRGLSVRLASGTVVGLFGASGSRLVANDMFCEGQSGMNGVALDPDFANNRFIYVYMASNLSTNPRTNRVVRLTLSPDFMTAGSRTDIITNIAYKDAATPQGGPGAHSGGRVRFGPDGFLYVTTGDNHNPTLPQDLTRLGGKVLRVTRDGSAAPGNNIPGGGDPRIFTYGHRNVQGITFRPGTGQPFTSEHGPNHSDEVTPLVAGGNGGWDPQNRSNITCDANSYCGYNGNPTTMPMTDTTRFPNAMRPSWNNNQASQGTGPSTFLTGTQWKGWDGRMIVGIMAAQRLVVIQLDANGMSTSSTDVTGIPGERYRSLVQGPDGNLYILAQNVGQIWRITPS
jgi:glucose/arabinose dehydrogenase